MAPAANLVRATSQLIFGGRKQPAVNSASILQDLQVVVAASAFFTETSCLDSANFYDRDDIQIGKSVLTTGSKGGEFYDCYKVERLSDVEISEQSTFSGSRRGGLGLGNGDRNPFTSNTTAISTDKHPKMKSRETSPKRRVGRVFSTSPKRKQSLKSPVRKTKSVGESHPSSPPRPLSERRTKKSVIQKPLSVNSSSAPPASSERKSRKSPTRKTISVGVRSNSPINNDDGSNNSSTDLQETRKCYYTLKQPKAKYISVDAAHQAILRLVLECKYLSRLQHPSILKVKGLPPGEEQALLIPSQGASNAFFMVTEQIVVTLDEKLERWKQASGVDRAEAETFELTSRAFRQKLQYAKEMASALQYLHEHNVALINLNPQTVGFLNDGTLQLADFSCCREYQNASDSDLNTTSSRGDVDDEDLIRLGLTPSKAKPLVATAISNANSLTSIAADGCSVPRYVAPEIMLDADSYSNKSDSYSWSLVVFEMLTLSKPFASFKAGQHLMKVCVEGQRPNLAVYKLPKDLEALLLHSWCQTVTKRWSMDTILSAMPAPRRRALRLSPSRSPPPTARNHSPPICIASSA